MAMFAILFLNCIEQINALIK